MLDRDANGVSASEHDLALAIEYAWKWFSVSAGQRMHAVNYFLVTAAVLATAYSTCLSEAMHVTAFWIASAGLIVTFVFRKIEVRTRELVKAAERALKKLEKRLASGQKLAAVRIAHRVESPASGWSYRHAFIVLHSASATAFLIAAIYAAVKGALDVAACLKR